MESIYHANQTRRAMGILSIFLLLLSGCTHSSTAPAATGTELAGVSQVVRISAADEDAAEPAIAASRDGSIYVAWVSHGSKLQADVMMAHFTSDGTMQGSAVRVNSQPGIATAWRGDPPTIAMAQNGTIYIGWTARVDSPSGHATDLFISSSQDGGKSFYASKVNDDSKPGEHGLHSLTVDKDDRIYVAWLDERNIKQPEESSMANMAAGHHMESNREVFVATSADGGLSFSPNKSIATNACPCCKTSLAVGSDGRLYLSWRQVLPGDFRHIALSTSTDGGNTFSKPVVVSDDQWVLKGCPVTGAALLPQENGKLRVLWYAAGAKGEQGIYWTESKDGGQTFSPRVLLAATSARGTPALVSDGDGANAEAWGVWEGNENGKTQVRAARLEVDEPANKTPIIVHSGELPVAAPGMNQLFIVYLTKENNKGSVWLTPARRNKGS